MVASQNCCTSSPLPPPCPCKLLLTSRQITSMAGRAVASVLMPMALFAGLLTARPAQGEMCLHTESRSLFEEARPPTGPQ